MGVKVMQPRGRPTPPPTPTPTPSKAVVKRSSRPSTLQRPSGRPALAYGPVILSILVPTIPGREAKLARLLASLDPQVASRRDVELLVLRDCRGMTIGEKRNRMISIARGEYVAFVDDDDSVVSDYVKTIASSLAEKPDVLCFDVVVNGHGSPKPCHYGLSLTHENLADRYHRKPNHIMAWRREIAAATPFPAIRTGEDTAWAELACRHASHEIRIPRSLYSYNYDPADNSATRR